MAGAIALLFGLATPVPAGAQVAGEFCDGVGRLRFHQVAPANWAWQIDGDALCSGGARLALSGTGHADSAPCNYQNRDVIPGVGHPHGRINVEALNGALKEIWVLRGIRWSGLMPFRSFVGSTAGTPVADGLLSTRIWSRCPPLGESAAHWTWTYGA
jgi:hypothetical protein